MKDFQSFDEQMHPLPHKNHPQDKARHMDETLRNELEKLSRHATARRAALLAVGLRKSKIRKHLNLLAGTCALLSAGAITTVITDYYGEDILQIVAAASVTATGVISLITTAYYTDDQITQIFKGASEYFTLRAEAQHTQINAYNSEEDRYTRLLQLREQYTTLDHAYARYLQPPPHSGSCTHCLVVNPLTKQCLLQRN